MELKIINNKGQEAGAVQFDDALVTTHASPAVLHEVVVAYLSGLRSGTHKAKTRSEVSGGGLKPWKQKHTGNARAGSTRSPLWRKGGIIFGPVPRDYGVSIPKKKKQIAFRMAIKSLLDRNLLQVVEPIQISEAKTKNVAAIYAKWKAPEQSVFLLDKVDPLFDRASRNIANVWVRDVNSFNAYEAMRARRVFVTPAALDVLTSRISKSLEN